jgi:hypothetical protein
LEVPFTKIPTVNTFGVPVPLVGNIFQVEETCSYLSTHNEPLSISQLNCSEPGVRFVSLPQKSEITGTLFDERASDY